MAVKKCWQVIRWESDLPIVDCYYKDFTREELDWAISQDYRLDCCPVDVTEIPHEMFDWWVLYNRVEEIAYDIEDMKGEVQNAKW